jgi:hypothetical protein
MYLLGTFLAVALSVHAPFKTKRSARGDVLTRAIYLLETWFDDVTGLTRNVVIVLGGAFPS